MTGIDQPTADDVILDLILEGVAPTHENLSAAVAAYPQHRDALVDFFVGLGVQSVLGPDNPPDDRFSAERFANIGLSHVLELHHRRTQAASIGARQTDPAAGHRLLRLAKGRGLDEPALAARVGLDEGVLMKLDLRRITGPRPMEMFRRLAIELEIPAAHVIAATTGPPLASSRGNLRKAKGAITVETETFEQAIRGSSLSEEAKAFWLACLAEEEAPNP